MFWKEIKDEQGVIDRLKTFEASYGFCTLINPPKEMAEKDQVKRIPLEEMGRAGYVSRSFEYDHKIGEYMDKTRSRLLNCQKDLEGIEGIAQ